MLAAVVKYHQRGRIGGCLEATALCALRKLIEDIRMCKRE